MMWVVDKVEPGPDVSTSLSEGAWNGAYMGKTPGSSFSYIHEEEGKIDSLNLSCENAELR